ncbi:NAD(P)-dependent dehydrogenase (short-subunit alcohol dehydrogenase family) [Scopulibacillus daqui]|uniref:NAD(P)-dependent dehydrogenase (Short-subunit alcohol dehydrogenase family) n=1 Tax=Scopulibacillus daqui TaxID=1469162 RepID=A0ABS2Q0E3_9BACL|nr:SDR family NAD(P)-dependent oxidoreductase [Scopulibacillus daqui]MBM7645653.1 NAD(P)-dependent dehydrogenase (short-subunit alcohol dehydrogenase family) [Scopulibacillus daqui]
MERFSQTVSVVTGAGSGIGDLHVLVNGAGTSSESSIIKLTAEEWDQVQETNLKSIFLVSKTLGKIMIKASEKKPENEKAYRSIVNIASLSGYKAGARIPHYSASKAGVINFTKALALELSPIWHTCKFCFPGVY